MGFSPTGTGRTVLGAVARGFGVPAPPFSSLAPRDASPQELAHAHRKRIAAADAVAVVAPVYAGRLPELVEDYLRHLAELRSPAGTAGSTPTPGTSIPALAVVVYGNRAYDDALLELTDLLTAAGFSVLAAAAFVGEHSYSTDDTPIAVGRPNRSDLEQAEALGARFAELCDDRAVATPVPPATASTARPIALNIPGSRPYRERRVPVGEAPITVVEDCILCGACEGACPLGIVSVTDHVVTDAKRCIACCACVKECPTGARRMERERILSVAARLSRDHATPLPPEVFAP